MSVGIGTRNEEVFPQVVSSFLENIEGSVLIESEEGIGGGFFIAPGILMTSSQVLPSKDVAREASVTIFRKSCVTPLFFSKLHPFDFFFTSPQIEELTSSTDFQHDSSHLGYTIVALDTSSFYKKIESASEEERDVAIRIYNTYLPLLMGKFSTENSQISALGFSNTLGLGIFKRIRRSVEVAVTSLNTYSLCYHHSRRILSGSPLLNKKGEVVALHSTEIDSLTKERFSYGVLVEKILDSLPSSMTLLMEDIIESNRHWIEGISITLGYHAPTLPKDFVSRRVEVEEIHYALMKKRQVFIVGESGAGKRCLALKYGLEKRNFYPFIYVISAETKENFFKEITKLAKNFFVNETNTEQQLEELNKIFKTKTNKKMLFIVTGIEEERIWRLLDNSFSNNENISLLMTSTKTKVHLKSPNQLLEIKSFRFNEALLELYKSTVVDKKRREPLAEKLSHSPLALKLVAGLIRNVGIEFVEGLEIIKTLSVDKEQSNKKSERLLVSNLIKIGLEQSSKHLKEYSPNYSVKEFFYFLSLFSTDPFSLIPRQLVEHYWEENPKKGKEILDILYQFGLVELVNFDACRLNFMIQEIVYDQIDGKKCVGKLLKRAVKLLNDSSDSKKKLTPHLLKIAGIIVEHHMKFQIPGFIELLNKFWEFNYCEGLYKESVNIAEITFKISDLQESQNTIHRIKTLNQLGLSYFKLGFYKKAYSFHEKALNLNMIEKSERDKEIISPFDLAQSYSGMGMISLRLGEYSRALNFQETAVKIISKKGDLLDEAVNLDKLGLALSASGEYEEALRHHSRAIKIIENITSKEKDLCLAYIFDNKGIALRRLGKFQDALDCQEEAFNLKLELLGKKHPDTVESLSLLGSAHRTLGNYYCALDYHKESLKQKKLLFGDQHPDVAINLSEVGLTLAKLGRIEWAISYLQKALEIREKMHPDLATSFDLVRVQEYDEVLKQLNQALEM